LLLNPLENLNAFEVLVTTIIMTGMIVVPIIALGGAAFERNWPALRRMVLFLLLSFALGAGLVWWLLHLVGR
jgi:membrane-associated PAP2 superfamily phosphatase